MRKTILSLLAVMLCAVLPSFSAIQYSLEPEGFETGVIPAGWTQENVNGTALWTVEGGADANLGLPRGARSGDFRAVLRGSSGQVEGFVTRLITPAMDLRTVYNPQLVFSHAQVARFGFFDTLRVYYRVNATAPWQPLVEYTSPVTNWKTETILLPSYQQGSAYQLAFEASDNAGLGVVLDDISVYPETQCQDATIQNISVASTSAVLSLVCNGSYSNFEVAITDEMVFNLNTFNPASALIHFTTDDYEVHIDSLDSYKTYYVYVRTDCDDNLSGHTNWVSAQFKTTRIVDLPYVEPFETSEAISGSEAFGTPRGWTCGGMQGLKMPAIYKGSTLSLRQELSVDSTAYLAFCGALSTSLVPVPADSVLYAISPEINGNLANCEVDFWGTVQNFFYTGGKQYAAELKVGVMTDPHDFGTMQVIETVKIDNALQFKHFRVSLASYTGNGKYIALVSQSNLENAFFIDNFTVRETTSPTPCDVRATNVLPTGFTVAANLHGADSWNLKVSTTYTRNPEALTAEECLVNQTGINAANYQVQLPETELAGKIVKIYVQAVKNNVASEWSFPLTLRVPTTGVVPIALTFNAGSYQTFSLKNLINEIHATSSAAGMQPLFSPLKAINIYPTTSSNTPVFDGAYLLLNGIDNYVVLPYISDLSNLEVTFRLSAGSLSYENNSRVAVGVMTDPYDLSTFTELGRYDGPTGRFEKVRVLLSAYKGSGHYVAVRALAPNTPNNITGSRNCIDNLIVQPVTDCWEAFDIKATAEARSAVIRWNPDGMTGFVVKLYSDANRTELISSVITTVAASATADSASFSNLIPYHTYYYTVQTICGSDTLIAEDVYSFSTKLGVPFMEEFEGLSYENPLPAGWDNTEGTVTNADYRFGAYPYNGNPGMCVRFNSYNSLSGQDNYLATPEITLDSAEMVSLTFDYKNPAGGACEVLYSLDGDTTRTILMRHLGHEEEYVTKTADLTPFLGHNIKIYFHATSNSGTGGAFIYLDNIGVKRIDPDCMGITELSVANVTETEADINWTVGGQQQVHLLIKDAYSNAVVFDSVVSTSPYRITGLTQNTYYNVLGNQPCGEEEILETSFKTACSPVTVADFGVENFATSRNFACWQVGIGDTNGIGQTYVDVPYILNDDLLSNVLCMNKMQNTSDMMYGNNYYAILPSLVVDSINKYQVVFNASTTKGDTANLHKLQVGVIYDPNDLGSFEVMQEVNLQYAKDSTNMKRYTVSFADYMGDYMGFYGTYVMFLVVADANHSNVAYIDNVSLEPASACAPVNDLEAMASTSSSLDLAWTGNAASYDVMLTTALCDPDTVTTPAALQEGITATHVAFFNLQAGTHYYAYIRANCSATEHSAWSGHTQVSTDYGIPFLETFDEMDQFPQDAWKVFNSIVPEGDDFTTAGFQKSQYPAEMSIEMCDWRIVNMDGKAACVDMYSKYNSGFLQSPSIDLTSVQAGTGINLSFRIGMVPISEYDPGLGRFTERIFRIYVSEDGGETFKADSKIEWNCVGTGDYDYAQIASMVAPMVNVDLSAYAGKSIALGFYSTTESYNDPSATVYIDSVALNVYDNSCMPVSRIKANASGTGVDLTWQVNAPGNGVVIELYDDPNYTNMIARDSLVGDSTHFDGLNYSTNYYVRAKVACSDEWRTMQFTTPYGIPFTEDYEGGTYMIPSAWKGYSGDLFANDGNEDNTVWSVSNQGGGGSTSAYAYTTVSQIYDWWTGSTYYGSYAMITPDIYLQGADGKDIKFYYDMALTTSEYNASPAEMYRCMGHTFMVVIKAAGDTAWTPLQTWKDSALLQIPSQIAMQEINLTQYANKTVNIAFYAYCDSLASSSELCHIIDNVRLRYSNPNCAVPEVFFSESNQTTATINWEAETGVTYEAQISLSNAFTNVLDTISTTNSQCTFENLKPGATYYVRLKKDCGNDGESAWSEPLMVRTTCYAVSNYPWEEDFDMFEKGTFDDPCWSNEHLSGYGKKTFEIFEYPMGINKTPKLVLPDQTYGTETMLALPTMLFDTTKLYEFTFSIYRNATYYGTSEMEGIYLYLADNAVIDANALPFAFIPRDRNVEVPGMIQAESGDGWHTYSFIIRASGEKRILIRGYNENSAPTYLDNLSVREFASGQTIKELSLAGTSRNAAKIQWTLVDNAICHDVELVASPTKLDSAGLEAATKIQASDVMDYTFTGLVRESTYYFYVRTVCDGEYGSWMSTNGTTTGLEGNVQAILGKDSITAYLVYTSYLSSYSQHIYTAQELADAGYSAGPIQSVAFKYTGYSADDKTQTVLIGSTDRTSFSSGASSEFITDMQVVYGPTLQEYASGWVTYEFTEPYIWDGMSSIVVAVLTNGGDNQWGSYGWTTAGTDVPEARTVIRYGDEVININNLDAPGINGYFYATRPNARFTQQYAYEACPAVETVEAAHVGRGTSEIRVSWKASEGDFVADYSVYIATDSLTDFTNVTPQYTVDSLSLPISGLQPETTYYIYVRANCNAAGQNDGISPWVGTTITTYEHCMPMTDFAVTFPTTNSALVTWSKYTDVQESDFRYILSEVELDMDTLDQYMAITTTDTSHLFQNLAYETTHHLYIRGACGDSYSDWADFAFTTLESCQPVVNIQLERATTNAARISWSRAPFALEQMWEVGIEGNPASVHTVTDTFATFAGLSSNTEYTAYVRAICSQADSSSMATFTFSTSAVAESECFTYAVDDPATYPYPYGNLTPYNNNYGCSWTQMIYPADYLGQEGNITSIAFYCATVANNYGQNNVTIYLANTSMAEATTNTSWVPMADLEEVFHQQYYVHPVAEGWSVIQLDKEFEYTGGNLAVVVAVDNGYNYTGRLTYKYNPLYSGSVLYRRTDGNPSFAEHPGTYSGDKSNNLPIAQFCFATSSCPKVKYLAVSNVTTESASVSWFPGSNESSWYTILSEKPLSAAEIASAQKTVVGHSALNLTDLQHGKDYFLYVAPNCGTEVGEWVNCHFSTVATCFPPVDVRAENVEESEADIYFDYGESGPVASYDVIYGPAATFSVFEPTTYQLVTVTDTVAHITGMMPDTYYSVAVRAHCSDDDASRYSELATFLTECGTITTFPWSENFETYPTGDFYNHCWGNEHTATESPTSIDKNKLYQVVNHTVKGETAKVLVLQDAKRGNKTQLTLPRMNFSADQPLEFSISVYRTHAATTRYNEGLHIYISNTDTIDETAQLVAFIPREYSINGINVSAADAVRWCTYHFQLPAIGEGHIVIEGVSEYTLPTYFDNLEVAPFDADCGGVSSLEVTDVDVSSATISWATIGNDTVRAIITNEEGIEIINRKTTAKSLRLSELTPGMRYKVEVMQLCSERSLIATFKPTLTIPYFEDVTKPAGWQASIAGNTQYYYWKTTTDQQYVIGDMSGAVFHFFLYYYMANLESRLMSPVIRVPELGSDEILYLDWLMGATPYEYGGGGGATSLDPSTVFSVDICEVDTNGVETAWMTEKLWSGADLSEIAWKTSDKYTLDLTKYAGKDIRLGFFASINGAYTTTSLMVDDIYLHRVKDVRYDASTCSWTDYMDDYFDIPLDSFVLGTTEYQTVISGIGAEPDTLVTMNLTVSEATQTILYDTICEGELYDRYDINPFIARTSVIKPHFYTSVNGCDSLVSLHIEVKPSTRRDTTILACKDEPVTINGKTYYNNIVVIDTLKGVNACDSIARTFIEFSETSGYEINQHRIICAGDTYTDAAFPNGISAAGTYTATVKTAYGCDSVVTVNMLVANNGVAYDTITIDELPYVYAEDTILGTNVGKGDYEFKLQATCGQVMLYITVKDKEQAVDNLKVLQLSVAPNPASVGEPIEILSQVSMAPDFSLMVFDAIGQLVYTTDEPSLTIPGLPVAGYYTVRLTSDGQSFQAKLLVK